MSEILTESLEDYLEAIFHIIARKEAARPKDIARRLGVSNASVTGALKILSEKGMINYAPYDVVTFTERGRARARDVVRRHELLRDFFIKVLGADVKDSDAAACKMEHSIPKSILDKLAAFADFIEACPRGGGAWVNEASPLCGRGVDMNLCDKCVAAVAENIKNSISGAAKGGRIVKSLKDLKPGQRGKILRVNFRGNLHKRVMEMGLTAGSIVEIERVAPLGDPVEMKVKGYHLSLRKDEAAKIEVEAL